MADITHSIYVDAPPSRVYRALTRADEVARWWCVVDIVDLDEVTADPIDAGVLRIQLHRALPDKLVNWQCVREGSKGCKVTIEFFLWPKRDGTQLVLSHSGVKGEADIQLSAENWTHYLSRLKSLVERGFADYHAGRPLRIPDRARRVDEPQLMEG